MDGNDVEAPPPIEPITTTAARSSILFDTVFLLVLRIIFFLLARKFLLANLNATLRGLSKPENVLPVAGKPAVAEADITSKATSFIPGSEFELEDGPETEEDRISIGTPVSSYPGSPVRTPQDLSGSPRDSYVRRGTDDGYLAASGRDDSGYSSLPTIPESGGGIELENLGRKLKDVGKNATSSTISVLNLTHGRRKQDRGTKAVKQTTRELSRLTRVLFALCFAEGCTLLMIVIFHALGILHSRARHVNFSASLHIMLAMTLIVIPLVQCLLFTYRSRDTSSLTASTSKSSGLSFTSRFLIALIPFALYIFLFSRIPPYVTAMPAFGTAGASPAEEKIVPSSESTGSTIDDAITKWSTSGPEGWEGEGWLAPSLGRVIVLGVIVLGSLSGFGAVRTAWNFIEYAWSSRGSQALTESDVLQAERSLYRIRHEAISKREELARATVTGAVSPSGRGWMGRVFGTKGDQEAASIQAELAGLKAMERQVSRSLSAMKLRKRRQEFSQTLRGKIYNIVGYTFATYCAARLLMCLPSLFLTTSRIPEDGADHHRPQKGNTNGDWISYLLALAISHFPTGVIDIDVAVWSRAISLLLTGVLILSSLTQVLRSLSRILRLTSKTVGAGFLLLSLGQLFSTYVISLLVQLRTALPPAPAYDTDPFSPFYTNTTTLAEFSESSRTVAEVDDSLLSTLPDFRVFGRLFDVVFFGAAVGTALYRYIAMKVDSAEDSGDIYRN